MRGEYMKDENQSRMAVIEQGAEEIRRSNLFSDTFASIALEDRAACQYVIRKILGMEDLQVLQVKGQYRLMNLTAKDAILDAFVQDSEGRLINVEIQRRDTVDHARRTRYYSSMIDKSCLDKGSEHRDLPDVYIIYISDGDLWGGGRTVYPIKKYLGDTGIPYDDGNYVIYVNAAVDDGSEVARMMQYFKTADPDDMSQGDLSSRVNFLKREKGGYEIMCEAAEKIYYHGIEQGREQGKAEGKAEGRAEGSQRRLVALVLHMHDKNYSEEQIVDVTDESLETIKEIIRENR